MSTVQPAETSASPYGPVTAAMVAHLHGTRPWVRFLSILCFIGAGLLVLLGLFMMAFGAKFMGPELAPGTPGGPLFGVIVGLVYMVIAAFYVLFAWILHRYASALAAMKAAPDLRHFTWAMETALDRQRSFWKLVGIVALVTIGLYGAIIAIAIVVGIVAAMAGAK